MVAQHSLIGVEKMKKAFLKPELTLIYFLGDVIATSGQENGGTESNGSGNTGFSPSIR